MDRLERSHKIMEILNKQKKIRVRTLSEMLSVSDVTVRKDLDYLSKKGLILKTHGMVRLYTEDLLTELPYAEKRQRKLAEKDAIAKKACESIKDGDIIFLAPGTTVSQMANYLKTKKNLTVVTNDIYTAYMLSGKSNIKLVLTGGFCREHAYSLIGSAVPYTLERFYASKAFIACSSFSIKRGVTTPIIEEGVAVKVMIKNSNKTIVLADSSKYEKEAMYQIAPIDEIDQIITDKNFPKSDIPKFRNYGVEIIRC